MFNDQRRTEYNLQHWQQQGWITTEIAALMRADLAARRPKRDLAGSLAILGAILIGFAMISFVAANWSGLAKISKLSLIAATLIGGYAGAIALLRANQPNLAQAALLGATLAYGGAIMLISQIYHLDGHAPDAVWLWAVGALIAGALIPSNPTLAAALILFTIWSVYERTIEGADPTHWAFLPYWAATVAGFWRTMWRPGLHMAALALSIWIVVAGYTTTGGAHGAVLLTGLAICAVSIIANRTSTFGPTLAPALAYGMAIAFAATLALQFFDNPPLRVPNLLIPGAATLAALIGGLIWASRHDNRPALWTAYVAFSIEVLALYLAKLGTLMGSAAFFLVAGLLVIGLSALAVRLHQFSLPATMERQP